MNTVIYSSAYTAPRCHEPEGNFLKNHHPLFVGADVVHDLDALFPELYCAAETAITYFVDEGGSEPPLIAAALKTTRDRLHRILVEAGLLDAASTLSRCGDPNT